MDLTNKILESISSDVKQNISDKVGLAPGAVEDIINLGVPVLLGGLGKNATDSQGAAALSETLDQKHDGSLLNSIGNLFANNQNFNQEGQKILGHIFGEQTEDSKNAIGKKTGIDPAVVAQVLSFIAPLVLAQLGKQKKDANLGQDGLSDLLTQQKAKDGTSIIDIANQFLDKNGDGQVIDDIIGMFKKGGK